MYGMVQKMAAQVSRLEQLVKPDQAGPVTQPPLDGCGSPASNQRSTGPGGLSSDPRGGGSTGSTLDHCKPVNVPSPPAAPLMVLLPHALAAQQSPKPPLDTAPTAKLMDMSIGELAASLQADIAGLVADTPVADAGAVATAAAGCVNGGMVDVATANADAARTEIAGGSVEMGDGGRAPSTAAVGDGATASGDMVPGRDYEVVVLSLDQVAAAAAEQERLKKRLDRVSRTDKDLGATLKALSAYASSPPKKPVNLTESHKHRVKDVAGTVVDVAQAVVQHVALTAGEDGKKLWRSTVAVTLVDCGAEDEDELSERYDRQFQKALLEKLGLRDSMSGR